MKTKTHILTESEIQQLSDTFLGKKVEVIGDGGRYVGVVDFIGYNQFLPSYGFQVTLDRMPVSNVNPNSIKLFKM
jgi:histidyl-tRNA synthetase